MWREWTDDHRGRRGRGRRGQGRGAQGGEAHSRTGPTEDAEGTEGTEDAEDAEDTNRTTSGTPADAHLHGGRGSDRRDDGGAGSGYHHGRQTSTADGTGCSGGSAATTNCRATGSSATVAGHGYASGGILCSGDSEAKGTTAGEQCNCGRGSVCHGNTSRHGGGDIRVSVSRGRGRKWGGGCRRSGGATTGTRHLRGLPNGCRGDGPRTAWRRRRHGSGSTEWATGPQDGGRTAGSGAGSGVAARESGTTTGGDGGRWCDSRATARDGGATSHGTHWARQ